MAPFLHSLVKSVRPRTVVEVGSGYSTMFLLHALQQCAAEQAAEKIGLLAKTRRFQAAGADSRWSRA
jgi:predicted O-methyltransferase YrrM